MMKQEEKTIPKTEMVIKKLFCPICGKEMMADLHCSKDSEKYVIKGKPNEPFWTNKQFREMDTWICMAEDKNEPISHCIVFYRNDIKKWLE